MAAEQLSDRERAFIEAARREAAKKRAGGTDAARPAAPARSDAPARPTRPSAPRGATTPLDQQTVIGWNHPAADPTPATTPLDQPTVLGWDNPAAQQSAATAKWERISALMAAERDSAEAERRKVRRYGMYVSAALFAAGILTVFALWPKPGA